MSLVLKAVGLAARQTPRRVCLSAPGVELTCQDLDLAVKALAARLSEGSGPVGVALDNGPAWVIADLAIIVAGRVGVPLPPFFTADQRHHALADAGASLLILPGAAGVEPFPVTLAPTGLAARPLHVGTAKITYTSGSTGQPKGVCLSQAQMEAVASSLVSVLGREQAGVHLPVLPLGVLLENVAGLYPTLLAGGRYHALGLAEVGMGTPFQPDFRSLLEAIVRDRVTSLILVPEMLRGLIAEKRRQGIETPSLGLIAVGGARVSPTLLAAAKEAGLPVVEGYGLSECASVVAMNRPGETVHDGVGRPLPHLSISIARDGEIIVGPHPFLGYVGGPPADGPVHTGDVGAMDDDGRLRIHGRKSNTIITAFGRNVAPEWVESELLAEPTIVQAMVFGEAQAGLGALIVPAAGAGPTQIAEAVARANQRLPNYASVLRWRATPPFDPRAGQLTANGRPRRAILLQTYADFVAEPA